MSETDRKNDEVPTDGGDVSVVDGSDEPAVDDEGEEDEGGRVCGGRFHLPGVIRHHDLGPIHSVLLDLAISLQLKVLREINSIRAVRAHLAEEMLKVCLHLERLGEVTLPSGLRLPQVPVQEDQRSPPTISSPHPTGNSLPNRSTSAHTVSATQPTSTRPKASAEPVESKVGRLVCEGRVEEGDQDEERRKEGREEGGKKCEESKQDGKQREAREEAEGEPRLTLDPSSPFYSALCTINDIHQYRDVAVRTLRLKAEELFLVTRLPVTEKNPQDFNVASDDMDKYFYFLRSLLDQIGVCAKQLQSRDGEENTLRKFSAGMVTAIDRLEQQHIMEKMGELSYRSCSIQCRKPVRSIGHTLDLQEIMFLAKCAKSMVYEISLHMLKLVDYIKGKEISCTASYHALTKENSELLRRYCLYLKLKIQQL